MKFLKTILVLLLSLIIIAGLAIAFFLILFINPNKMKPVIADEVLKKTGYVLNIEGDLNWSFYPRLGVKVEHMTLTAPKATRVFADLHDVRIGTALSEILHGGKKLRGNIYVNDIKVANLHFQNVSTKLNWENKILTLDPIQADLYDGTLKGIAHGQSFAGNAKWDWQFTIHNIQIKNLLQDVNGVDSKIKISGLTNININASATGKNKNEFLRTLNGLCTIAITQGMLEGIDFNYLVESANALINHTPLTVPDSNITQFDHFNASFNLQNGLATTNDMLLTSAAFTSAGTGTINLPQSNLNLRLAIKPQQNPRIPWEIPVIISGDFARPDVRLDTTALGKFIVNQNIDKVKAKVSDQIKKRIPGKAGEFLQNLINQ